MNEIHTAQILIHMCFFIQQITDTQSLENRFKRQFQDVNIFQSKAVINAFEHPVISIIIPNENQFTFFEWGLIPYWAKNDSIQKSTLNARIETLIEKPSFKNVLSNRCLIPVTGFYEWQWLDAKGKTKQRYLIQTQKQVIFSLAGLTSQWVDLSSGETRNTFTIITTQANDLMAEIHNIKKRMPVILNENDEGNWLNGGPIQTFAFPYQVDLMANIF